MRRGLIFAVFPVRLRRCGQRRTGGGRSIHVPTSTPKAGGPRFLRNRRSALPRLSRRPTRGSIVRWTGRTTSSATRRRSDTRGPATRSTGPHPIADASVHFGGPSTATCRVRTTTGTRRRPHAHFEMKGGAYWYAGAYDPVFYAQQPQFVVINDVYAPLVYTRPVIDVAIAPPAFHAEFIVGAVRPGAARAGARGRAGTVRGRARVPGWRGPDPARDGDARAPTRSSSARGGASRLGHRDHEHDRGWHGGAAFRRDTSRVVRSGWHGGPARDTSRAARTAAGTPAGGPPAERRRLARRPRPPNAGAGRQRRWRRAPSGRRPWQRLPPLEAGRIMQHATHFVRSRRRLRRRPLFLVASLRLPQGGAPRRARRPDRPAAPGAPQPRRRPRTSTGRRTPTRWRTPGGARAWRPRASRRCSRSPTARPTARRGACRASTRSSASTAIRRRSRRGKPG